MPIERERQTGVCSIAYWLANVTGMLIRIQATRITLQNKGIILSTNHSACSSMQHAIYYATNYVVRHASARVLCTPDSARPHEWTINTIEAYRLHQAILRSTRWPTFTFAHKMPEKHLKWKRSIKPGRINVLRSTMTIDSANSQQLILIRNVACARYGYICDIIRLWKYVYVTINSNRHNNTFVIHSTQFIPKIQCDQHRHQVHVALCGVVGFVQSQCESQGDKSRFANYTHILQSNVNASMRSRVHECMPASHSILASYTLRAIAMAYSRWKWLHAKTRSVFAHAAQVEWWVFLHDAVYAGVHLRMSKSRSSCGASDDDCVVGFRNMYSIMCNMYMYNIEFPSVVIIMYCCFKYMYESNL